MDEEPVGQEMELPKDEAAPSSMNEVWIPAADGYPLAASVFPPAGGKARCLVVVSAATGVPRRFYSRYARHLAAEGAAVLIYDYRGVAGSRPERLRGFEAGLEHWVADLEDVVLFARDHYPEADVRLLGHSIGGVVSLFSTAAAGAHRIITLGAQTSYWKDWPLGVRFHRFALWHLAFPIMTSLAGYFPGRRFGLGEDLPKAFARQWAACWRGPGRLASTLPAHRLRDLGCPVAAVGVRDDTIGTERALLRLHELLPREFVDYHWIDPRDHGLEQLGHFDAFRRVAEAGVWGELDSLILEGSSV